MKRGSVPRPALLVSVRSPAEAAAALAGGADVIDVKDPAAGSLGAAAPSVCGDIAEAVGQQAPWTMACGELADGLDRLAAHLAATWQSLQEAGPATRPFPLAIKVGLAGCERGRPWRRQLAEIAHQLPAGVGQEVVIYADAASCGAPPAAEVLEAAFELRAMAVLVDTFNKQSDGLLGQQSLSQLQAWRMHAAAAGCRFVVAGKLGLEDFAAVATLGADIIAVRSAVCSHGRSGPVVPQLVRRVREGLIASTAGALLSETENMEKRS